MSDDEAANIRSMAWSPKTFNYPEFMNRTLSSIAISETFDALDTTNLYVLRKLLLARKIKRASFDGTDRYHAKKMLPQQNTPVPNKTVLASTNPNAGPTRLADLKNVVVWIDSL